jgi:hypothetical protein
MEARQSSVVQQTKIVEAHAHADSTVEDNQARVDLDKENMGELASVIDSVELKRKSTTRMRTAQCSIIRDSLHPPFMIDLDFQPPADLDPSIYRYTVYLHRCMHRLTLGDRAGLSSSFLFWA